ncbi:MAG: hypothetical protein AAF997_07360 [Myxococcota bacterium]
MTQNAANKESAPTPLIPGGWVLAGLLACMVLGVLHFLLLTTTYDMTDDAFIYFRYVENLLAGDGLTWNPGHERVEGYTGFLFLALLAVPAALGAHLPSFVHILNLILLVALLYSMARFVAVGVGAWKPIALVAPLLTASSYQVIVFSRGGMETVLFALLLVVALHVALFGNGSRRNLLLSGVLFGLLALTRPDGILGYVVYVGYTMAASVFQKRAVPWRDELHRLAGLVAVLLPHLVFRIAYYGEVVPNTFHAKVGFTAPSLKRGLQAILNYLTTLRAGILLGAAGLWALAPRTRVGNVLALFLTVWLLYLGSIGLSGMNWWYAMPLDVISILWLSWSLTMLLESRQEDEGVASRPRAIGILALVALCVASLAAGVSRAVAVPSFFAQGLYEEPSDTGQKVTNYIKVGKLMADIAEPDETMAVAECGAIPYYAGIVTYDAVGLNDKHIARQPVSDGVWAFGHEKGDARYLLEQKPTYVIMKPFLTRRPDGLPVGVPSWHQMYRMGEFRRDYELVSEPVDGLYFNYYRRRPSGSD